VISNTEVLSVDRNEVRGGRRQHFRDSRRSLVEVGDDKFEGFHLP
jgi:hypothetical protein